MTIKVNGKTYEGTAVLPRADVYHFEVTAAGNLDMFTLETCFRSWEKQRAWNVTTTKRRLLWKKKIEHKNKVTFDYIPSPKFEKDQYCALRLGGYEMKQGRHSWAFIDIEDPNAVLPSKIYCNGEVYKSNGVAICQARQGLIQGIEFGSEVKVLPEKGCELGKQKGKIFEYNIKRGRCVYAFMETKSPHRVHRLTTIGNEKSLIRN